MVAATEVTLLASSLSGKVVTSNAEQDGPSYRAVLLSCCMRCRRRESEQAVSRRVERHDPELEFVRGAPNLRGPRDQAPPHRLRADRTTLFTSFTFDASSVTRGRRRSAICAGPLCARRRFHRRVCNTPFRRPCLYSLRGTANASASSNRLWASSPINSTRFSLLRAMRVLDCATATLTASRERRGTNQEGELILSRRLRQAERSFSYDAELKDLFSSPPSIALIQVRLLCTTVGASLRHTGSLSTRFPPRSSNAQLASSVDQLDLQRRHRSRNRRLHLPPLRPASDPPRSRRKR